MEFLDTKDASFVVDDALLDFTLEGEEDDQLSHKTISGSYSSSSTVESSNPAAATAPFCDETGSGSFPVSFVFPFCVFFSLCVVNIGK